MISSLLLAFLLLAPAPAAIPRADSQCLACGGPALDLDRQRELLLDLAKRSILDKLRLSQRPTLSRPVSRAALRTVLQHLHGPPQGTLLEADREQEYEIISFADTGGFLCYRSSPNHLTSRGKETSPPSLTPVPLPQTILLLLPMAYNLLIPGSHPSPPYLLLSLI